MNNKKFAVVIPLANESDTFAEFSSMLIDIFDRVKADNSFLGDAYLVVDNVSKDNTLQLCQELHERDSRFIPVWAPENRNVVDAYLRGYKEALLTGVPDTIARYCLSIHCRPQDRHHLKKNYQP